MQRLSPSVLRQAKHATILPGSWPKYADARVVRAMPRCALQRLTQRSHHPLEGTLTENSFIIPSRSPRGRSSCCITVSGQLLALCLRQRLVADKFSGDCRCSGPCKHQKGQAKRCQRDLADDKSLLQRLLWLVGYHHEVARQILSAKTARQMYGTALKGRAKATRLVPMPQKAACPVHRRHRIQASDGHSSQAVMISR